MNLYIDKLAKKYRCPTCGAKKTDVYSCKIYIRAKARSLGYCCSKCTPGVPWGLFYFSGLVTRVPSEVAHVWAAYLSCQPKEK